VHQKIDNTEYSLDLLEKNELNIAEQLQLNRLLKKEICKRLGFLRIIYGIIWEPFVHRFY
jgi:hypothetical protein